MTERGPSHDHPSVVGSSELSMVQLPIWFHEQFEPGTTAVHVPLVLELVGGLDIAVLRRALDALVADVEMLRVGFVEIDGRARFEVRDGADPDVELVDGRTWSEIRIGDYIADVCAAPFDLDRPPLVRVRLVTIDSTRQLLVAAVHHLVADLWGATLLFERLVTAIGALAAGSAPTAHPERHPYSDFVRAERDYVDSERADVAREHWENVFDAVEPMDLCVGARRTSPGAAHAVDLTDQEWARIRELARATDISPRSVIHAALHLVLGSSSGSRRTHFAELVANRNPRHARTVGTFANRVARTAELAGDQSIRALIDATHAQVVEGRAHERFPFVDLVRDRQMNGLPGLFDVSFSWHKVPRGPHQAVIGALVAGRDTEPIDLAGIAVHGMVAPVRPVLTPLVVVCIEDRDRLRILLEYRTANFDRATIGRFGDRLRQTLRTMVLHPDLAIGEIDFVLPSELARWRDEWAAADEDGHLPTALERFARCVDAAPDAAAVRCRGEIVSYRSLSESSAVMAAHLVEAGLGPGSVIAICAERSPEVVAAMLAVWRVGAAFVPIDPALPARRVSVMCAAARVDAVLTEERYLDVFAEARPRPELLLLGADGIRASDGDQTRRAVSHGDDDRAYIIFTSGTSGEPKGVEVTHENLANLIGAMVREPGIGADDVVLAHTTLSFDISMVEIVVPLSVGATIELLTREEATDPSAVMERLATVTVAQATPTMWRALIASGWEGQPHLRVLCGGEGLPVDLTEQLWDRCAELWNMYGPTETTVWSTVARLDVIDSDVPIGHAIDRTRLYVLDDRGRLVPEGVAGELWIAGAGVARGYAGRDDLTAERFRRDPFVPSGRMYRTGDLVRRRVADGELVCLGRADDQIKLRGHRIELGEVEAVMRSFTDVGDAAATIKSYGPTDQRLIAYLTPARSDSPPSVEEVRTWLAEQLPTYMRPSSIVQLEELPRTANGKLDRARLPLPESPIGDLDTVSGEEAAPHDPSDETEELVAQLFCRVLSIDSVPRDVSFFDLGGHSLLATELIAALRERLGVEVPIATLFAAPTVATLSKRIDANEVAHRWTSLVPVQPSGDGTPFFYVAPFLITAASFTYMGRAFRDRRPFYVLQPQGFDGTATGHTTVEAMASHYIGEMRSVQAAGPYLIGGHCAGATVAFEVAHQLHESGEMVDLLVLVDAEPPHVRRPIGGIRRLRGQISLYAREGRLLEAVKWSARVAYERVVLTRFGNRYVRNTAAIRREHAQAHSRYEPGRYDGSALLIRSAEWSASPEFDWHFRWRELLGGDLVVDSLEGTHAGLVDRSQSARLADRILTAINDRQVAPRQA